MMSSTTNLTTLIVVCVLVFISAFAKPTSGETPDAGVVYENNTRTDDTTSIIGELIKHREKKEGESNEAYTCSFDDTLYHYVESDGVYDFFMCIEIHRSPIDRIGVFVRSPDEYCKKGVPRFVRWKNEHEWNLIYKAIILKTNDAAMPDFQLLFDQRETNGTDEWNRYENESKSLATFHVRQGFLELSLPLVAGVEMLKPYGQIAWLKIFIQRQLKINQLDSNGSPKAQRDQFDKLRENHYGDFMIQMASNGDIEHVSGTQLHDMMQYFMRLMGHRCALAPNDQFCVKYYEKIYKHLV